MQITPAPGRTGQLYYLKGDDKRIVVRGLDMGDTEAVQRAVAQALQQYPTQALKLAIMRSHGSSFRTEETISLTAETPALAGSAAFPERPVTHPTPAFASASPPGMDHFSSYLLNEKDTRIREKDDVIRELRDSIRIQGETIRTQKEKLDDQALQLRFKDREHEIQLSGVEASQQHWLTGLVQQVISQPEVLTLVANKFIGGGALSAALPAGGQLAGLSPGHQRVAEGILNLLPRIDEETGTKIFVVVQHLVQHPAQLEQFIQTLTTNAH